ncbi:MAG: methyltransferase domain-containing protein [Candidatus Spechtbacterales bacterium]|nr:methyltransferase domain-containing protein [Candidatus Spechtbacterales bacterium]
MPSEIEINNKKIYLERMSKPLQEKLKVVKYFPSGAKRILDVGCADGTVTIALAQLFPNIEFLGIDLDKEFISIAKDRAKEEGVKNVSFKKCYLRDLLQREEKYDAVVFISVMHEFYSYGEGISSVLKAMADAHELLVDNGEIVVRDMILHEYTKHTKFNVDTILEKIRNKKDIIPYLDDFEEIFGKADSIYKANHFLLKYFYTENWDRESKEYYVPVTFEQYQEMFSLLGMDMQYMNSYTIPFLSNKWMQDFGLTKHEIESLSSTGFIVARKK